MSRKGYRAWREQKIHDGWSKCLEELEKHAEDIRKAKKIGQHEVFIRLEEKIRNGHISACSEYQKIISEIAQNDFNPFTRISQAVKISRALRKFNRALSEAQKDLGTIRTLRHIPNGNSLQ